MENWGGEKRAQKIVADAGVAEDAEECRNVVGREEHQEPWKTTEDSRKQQNAVHDGEGAEFSEGNGR